PARRRCRRNLADRAVERTAQGTLHPASGGGRRMSDFRSREGEAPAEPEHDARRGSRPAQPRGGRRMKKPWYKEYFPATRPREARGGIKAQNKRGQFGESWWAQRWVSVLESFRIGARLKRGQAYARRG